MGQGQTARAIKPVLVGKELSDPSAGLRVYFLELAP